ncbi:MAG: hypothetical protein QNJ97_15140 [Myxococcota bacterium]|nr:hypothetical protein [Myxococcota bacterium]
MDFNIQLRQILATNRDIEKKFSQLEYRLNVHDEQLNIVFDAIEELTKPTNQPNSRPIGFGRKK